MRTWIRALVVAAAIAIAFAGTPANASPQWAVATSYSSVCLLNLQSDVLTNQFDPLLIGGSYTGVAIWNNYVFVADSSSGMGRLHVGQINTTGLMPTITWNEQPINLGALTNPGAVAVDATGGVYVISKTRTADPSGAHSYIAYIPSGDNQWPEAGLNLFDRPTGFLADIATWGTGSQAVIAHRDTSGGEDHAFGQTWVSSVTSSGLGGPPFAPDDKGYEPRGVTIGGSLAYVANYSTETGDDGATSVGSISVLSASTLQKVTGAEAAIQTGSFQPSDIAFFSLGDTNYLGMVGVKDGTSQAWRIELDANGLPLVEVSASGELIGGNVLRRTLQGSGEGYCTLSPDGTTFWITNPKTGNVTALDTRTWQGTNLTIAANPGYIAAFTPADSPVPEPSSVLALLTGAVGLFGAMKRRRR